jgi:hypothetical protein
MPHPLLEDVFKTSGVPTYTLVEPTEYKALFISLRSPGRGVVIEGPSGIGKTTAVETALKELGITGSVTKLSSRRPADLEYIAAIPDLRAEGTLIIDDFHKLPVETRSSLADYMKTLADEDSHTTKVVIVGINQAGHNLIRFAHDLVNRIDVIPFERNPDEKVRALIMQGAHHLNIDINVVDEIVEAAQGSFYLAQMLSREVCQRAGILESSAEHISTAVSFESVKAEVWDRLSQVYRERCERFCRGTKIKREGRAPYLHILWWLAEGAEWTLPLREAVRIHTGMRGSVGQVVDKGYLAHLVQSDKDISDVLHYDSEAAQLTVENPQFIFYIRNIPWRDFAERIGFVGIDFPHKYDFALSFAGEDRAIAEMLVHALEEEEVEVFYDHNEQHRILAADIEEYLRPIYQSEARFVLPLLSPTYPKKIWTKIESDQFKNRFGQDSVIPIWFTTAPPGMFDETRRIGGITFDPDKNVPEQLTKIAGLLIKKLTDVRGQLKTPPLQQPTVREEQPELQFRALEEQ